MLFCIWGVSSPPLRRNLSMKICLGSPGMSFGMRKFSETAAQRVIT